MTAKVTFSSSNEAILKVSTSGLLEGVGPGACDVLSIMDGIGASVKVEVRGRPDTSDHITRLEIRGKVALDIGEKRSCRPSRCSILAPEVVPSPGSRASQWCPAASCHGACHDKCRRAVALARFVVRAGSTRIRYRFFDEVLRSPWSPYPDLVLFLAACRRSVVSERPTSSISLNWPRDVRFANILVVPVSTVVRFELPLDFLADDFFADDFRAVFFATFASCSAARTSRTLEGSKAPAMPSGLRGSPFSSILSEGWCGREDLNLHDLAATSS